MNTFNLGRKASAFELFADRILKIALLERLKGKLLGLDERKFNTAVEELTITDIGEDIIEAVSGLLAGNSQENDASDCLREIKDTITRMQAEFDVDTSEGRRLYAEAIDSFQERIAKRIGRAPRVRYSAYDCDTFGVPKNNIDDVAVEGKVVFVVDKFHDVQYESPVVENPTWLDVSVLANEMIEKIGFEDHIFLENVYHHEGEKRNGVKVMRFSMGS